MIEEIEMNDMERKGEYDAMLASEEAMAEVAEKVSAEIAAIEAAEMAEIAKTEITEDMLHDVSEPLPKDAIHSVAVGGSRADYRALAQLKVIVDDYFRGVQEGRKRPDVAMMAIKEDIMPILRKY